MKSSCVLHVIILLCSTVQAQRSKEDLTKFVTSYQTIYPKRILGAGQLSDSLSTSVGEGKYIDHVAFRLSIDGIVYELKLHLNTDIVAENFKLLDESTGETTTPTSSEINFNHYVGVAVDKSGNEWSAVFTINDGLDGVIYFNDPVTIFQADYQKSTYLSEHIVFRTSDLNLNVSAKCGMNETIQKFLSSIFPNKGLGNVDLRTDPQISKIRKRSIETITKYIELHVVIEHSLVKEYSFPNQLTLNVLRLINSVDLIYHELNIRVVLTAISFFSDQNPFLFNRANAIQTVEEFALYRYMRFHTDPRESPWVSSDHSMLLTHGLYVQSANRVLGIAYLWRMCHPISVSYSGFEETALDMAFRPTVVAHEIGHSLGLQHDDSEACFCGAAHCVMNAFLSSNSPPTSWSSCSKEELNVELDVSTGECLRNRPKPLIVQTYCGNGLVEEGEECDCGTVSKCRSFCCNPSTCQLNKGAQCDEKDECCNRRTCQLLPPGTLCRELCHKECDVPEYCDGISAECPEDRLTENGGICNNGQDRCFEGVCLTKDRMCRKLGGPGCVAASPKCQQLNLAGDRYGNCGMFANHTFIPCSEMSVDCGKLYCKNWAHRLSEYKWSNSTVITNGTYLCESTVNLLTPRVIDYSYAQNWSGCFSNSGVCFQGQCVAFQSLCNDRCDGICNDAGNCHCRSGLTSPNCTSPGGGGSVDSGPVPLDEIDCMSHEVVEKTVLRDALEEIDPQLVCTTALQWTVSVNICPFVVRGYEISDLVLVGVGAPNPLQSLNVSKDCTVKADPFVRGKIATGRVETGLLNLCNGSLTLSSDGNLVYTNVLRSINNAWTDATRTIVHSRNEFAFKFICTIGSKIETNLSLHPAMKLFYKQVDEKEMFSIGIFWYSDSSYLCRVQINERNQTFVTAGSRVFVLLERLGETNQNYVLQVDSCWVTPEQSPSSQPYYQVIKHGCPAADLLGRQRANQLTQNCMQEVRFSFKAFRWTRTVIEDQLLYLHCNVYVCHTRYQDCSCQSCRGRRKRSINGKEYGTFTKSFRPLSIIN